MRPQIICTEDALFHPPEDTLKVVFLISLGVHSLFFLSLFLTDIFTPKKETTLPQTILVHSVKLLPKAKRPPTPAPPPPATPMPKQNPEPEIAHASPPEPESMPEQPQLKSEPESAPQPKEEPESSKHESHDPAPTPKPASKSKKVDKVQKVQKVVSSKSKPAPKTDSTKSSTKKASKTAPAQKKMNKQVADNVESLLAQARQQRKGSGSSSTSTSGGSPCGQVSTLSCEKGGTGTQETGEYGVEASEEDIYVSNLIRLIQLSLTIPDKEPVSLRITLSRSGALQSLTILSSSSSANKKAVEKGLSSLRFPSFGSAYAKETQHSFSLRLTREMEWVRF